MNINLDSISSEESISSLSVVLKQLSLLDIVSSEEFGYLVLSNHTDINSIISIEGLGGLLLRQSVPTTGIEPGTLGSPSISYFLDPEGFYFIEGLGSFSIKHNLPIEGIDSGGFGSLQFDSSFDLPGFLSGEIGSVVLKALPYLFNIPSQETVGALSIDGFVKTIGFESIEFGTFTTLFKCSMDDIATQESLEDSLFIDYFGYEQSVSWSIDKVVQVTSSVKWNVGLGVPRWYRVQGCCLFPTSQGSGEGISGPSYPGGCDVTNFGSVDSKCVGATGKQQFIQNILATSVSDVCRQINNYNMKWQVCSIQVYNNPAGPSQDSCNSLSEVPFSSYPECLEISVHTNALVKVTFTEHVKIAFKHQGSGGVTLSGQVLPTGATSLSSYSYIGFGGVEIGSSGSPSSSWDELLEVDASLSFEVLSTELVYPVFQPTSSLSRATETISTTCGTCTSIPNILYTYLNLEKSYLISRFVTKNSIDFPTYFPMYYNYLLRSWMSNYKISGYGDSGKETWNFVTSWSCLNQRAEEESSPYWKYSLFINRSFSNIDFDTRINITFPPQELCRLIDNFSIDISFSLNTITNYIDNSLVDVTDYVVLSDGIGVFKDNNWVADPALEVRISRNISSNRFQTIDLSPIIP